MGIDGVGDRARISAVELHNKPTTIRERIRKIFNNDKEQSPPKILEELANLTPESVFKPPESTSEISTTPISTEDIEQQQISQQINEIRQELGLLETKPEIKILPPDLVILSIEDFKEHIGSNSIELICKNNRQETLDQDCEWNVSTSINSAKKNHRHPPDNITDLQDKQWLVKKTLNNMSFKEKQVKDNERTEAIEKLTKYGVKNSESLVVALENAVSPLIYLKQTGNQEKPIDISYDHLFIENNLSFFQKINDLNNRESINPDFFKKIAIISGVSSNINKINSNINEFLIYDKFNEDQFSQTVSLISKYHDAFYCSSDILTKITSNNFSNEELENQLADDIKFNILFSKLAGLDNKADHSEITLQNLESFYLNSSSSINKLAVDDFLNSHEYKKFSLDEKQTIWQALSLGIGINNRSLLNYGDRDYNFELSRYSQILIKNFNSQDKDYLQTIINGFKNLDIKTISILSQFPDIIKTEKGIELIKFKINSNYQELINSFTEIIIDNNQEITNDMLQTAVLNNVDENLLEKLLKPENFTNFSPEDQKFWNYYLNIDCLDKDGIRDFITKNKQEFFNFFDTKNQPTSYFLESFAKSKFNYGGLIENGFLQTTLTPELIKNFSNSNDQKLWSVVSSVGGSYDIHTCNFIIENKNDCFKFFDTNNQPTAYFFESYLKIAPNKSILKLITSDFIKNRPSSEHQFWNRFSVMDDSLKTFFLINIFKNGNQEILNNPLTKALSDSQLSFFNQDVKTDIELGKYFLKKDSLSQNDLAFLLSYEQFIGNDLIKNNDQIKVDQSNWKHLLTVYFESQNEYFETFDPELKDKIDNLFNNPKTKNLCLSEMQKEWKSYLDSGKPDELPFSLNLLSKIIIQAGNIGHLTQVKSLNSLMITVNECFSKKNTALKTKKEILNGFSEIETKFINNNWSNEDRTDFNNLSIDIIEISPSLFSDYLNLLKKLSPSELKKFSQEVYPLYKTKLILMEKQDNYDNNYYEPRDLFSLRKDIRNFTDFNSEKEKLLEDIKQTFTNRFKIIKTPENFSQENIKSIKDISRYLSNLNNKTPEKENILGFYLSLTVNNRWDDFRNGEDINPREYLSEDKSEKIEHFLKKRQELISSLTTNIGIEKSDIPEFVKLLQSETQNVQMGDIETIDIKLHNIIQNLNELQDLDLYPDLLDKQRMELLQNYGNKNVGSTVAKLYKQLINPNNQISLTEIEVEIKQKITEICQKSKLDINNLQVLKENFQDGIKPFATLVNVSSFVKEINVAGEIETLRGYLEPSTKIIDIFTRLGENFKVTSGAMALSQDLDYLNNLVAKKEHLINPEEKTIISEYVSNIKNQVVNLEKVYNQIKTKFENLKQGNSSSPNVLLNQKLKEIETVINSQTTQQVITSTATNNLNTITENIRECLSCTSKGCNNDTDLTFGDINKFYLYSQSENQSDSSISDQLAYLEPVTRKDSSQEVSFILDNLYGLRNPSILENQIETIIKKNRIIKQRFPESKVSIFVSNAALSSSGTPSELLIKKLQHSKMSAKLEEIEVDIIESAAGDHYVEIGGPARTSGKRKVEGIVINI